jgi:hypothetical protein
VDPEWRARKQAKDRGERGRARFARNLRMIHGRYNTGRQQALLRGLAWDIERSDYEQLSVQPCRYCGNALNKSGAGLDRIDEALGYTLTNCSAVVLAM